MSHVTKVVLDRDLNTRDIPTRAPATPAQIRALKADARRQEFERVVRLTGAVVLPEAPPVVPELPGKPLTRAQKARALRDRKRAVLAAAQAEADAIAKAAKEKRDELLAPAAQRTPVPLKVARRGKGGKPEEVELHITRVEAATWNDPSDRNVETKTPWQIGGFRRRDGLRSLRNHRIITEAHWVAAEQFRDDLDVAGGATGKGAAPGSTASSSPGYGPAMRQLDAQARVRGAWQAVGLVLTGVFSWVVVSYGTMRDYETCKGVKHGRGAQLLITALGRLADFYAGRSPRAQAALLSPAPSVAERQIARPRNVDRDGTFEPWVAPKPSRETVAQSIALLRGEPSDLSSETC